ncbi:tetratricopeptide repeat protein [Candidatus Parvarchaeota archaeon]|nr:tetratricopeptide repeat protein [Candidatus Parvarchaeota archaeon]
MSDELEDSLVAKNEEEIEEKKLVEAQSTAQDLVDVAPADALAWFVKGKTLYLEGNFEEALSCLAQAASLDKQQPAIWHLMGLTLLPLNRVGEALDALQYASAALPNNSDIKVALGVACLLSGKLEEARVNFDQAYKADPQKTSVVANELYDTYISRSNAVEGSTKALLERMLETRKVAAINGYEV